MIGIILVTHGQLATEFKAAVEHVVGPQKQMQTLCIGPDDDMQEKLNDLHSILKEVDSGSGVIILTDMFGGTPSNLAISVMKKNKIDVIAGVNLPLLIKLSSLRKTHKISDVITECQEAGRRYICVASQILLSR